MFIKSVSIRNFRSIEHADIHIDRLTVVLGRNGSGKSTVLRALHHFFDLSVRVTDLDYFAKDTTREIEIGLTFSELSEHEREMFASYIQGDDLKVVKVFNENASQGLYHSFALQHPRFIAIRQMARKSDQLAAYRAILADFEGRLPRVTSADDALAALEVYEADHPEQCELSARPGQFLGPRNIGGGSLDKFTKFVFIPAVNTAEEEIGGKSGAIHQLIAAIADSYRDRDDVRAVAAEYKRRIAEIFDNDADGNKLREIADGVNQVLEDYAENSSLKLYWDSPEEPPLKLPEVIREIVDGDFGVDVKRVGHGLQRSLVIAILQYLALMEFDDREHGNLIIAFEEPEIYQHPSKCKFLFDLLKSLTVEGARAQVLMVTHSPYFVDPASFDSLVYARKARSETVDNVRATKFYSLDLFQALDDLAVAMGKDRATLTRESLIAFSKPVFNPIVSESFFAEAVLLVEGETEVGVFAAVQSILGLNWERKGISVVPCGGKTKLDKPFLVLSGLGIDTYLVFDWDSSANAGADAQYNRGYQILAGAEDLATDMTESTIIGGRALVFVPKIEEYLRANCGEDFDEIATLAASQTGNIALGPAQALKRADTAKRFIEIACVDFGKTFPLIYEFSRTITEQA